MPNGHPTARGMCLPGAILFFAAALLASCDGIADNDLAPPDGVSLEAATILTEHTDTGTATLEDGEFRAPVAPGSASELEIRLNQWTLGDLDGDGLADAAAITIENPGGSGNFRYLHAILNEEGELHDADVVFLGDRIRVEGLSIHDGVITVAVLDRPPGAPFAETPSILIIRRFRLVGEALEEISGISGADAFACDDSLPDAALIVVTSPAGGMEVASGFAVAGCSRTFESNVQWRLLDRAGECWPAASRWAAGSMAPRPSRSASSTKPASGNSPTSRCSRTCVRRRGVPAATRRRAGGDRRHRVMGRSASLGLSSELGGV